MFQVQYSQRLLLIGRQQHSIPVSNLEKSVVFYDQVMATIGFTRIMTMCETVCYGIPNRSYAFWLGRAHDGFKTLPPDTNRFPGVHICLQAPNRKAVDDFYKTALKLGATDEGKPGIRSDYTPVSSPFPSFLPLFILLID